MPADEATFIARVRQGFEPAFKCLEGRVPVEEYPVRMAAHRALPRFVDDFLAHARTLDPCDRQDEHSLNDWGSQRCRTIRDGPRPTEAHRRWWLDRFTLDESREMGSRSGRKTGSALVALRDPAARESEHEGERHRSSCDDCERQPCPSRRVPAHRSLYCGRCTFRRDPPEAPVGRASGGSRRSVTDRRRP
jgi:hypothetical protein